MISVAMLATGWAIFVAPIFWSEAFVSKVAGRILGGEIYKPEVMKGILDKADLLGNAAVHPAILSKIAIIRLRSAEEAIASGDQQRINNSLAILEDTIVAALSSQPTDAFQWLILFWLNDLRGNAKFDHVRYLRMSYALGPNEGWIAAKRNKIALAHYANLPRDLADYAVVEFVSMVRSQLYEEAKDVIAGPGWPNRHLLLLQLKDLNENTRRIFSRVLYDKGLDDVPVPGIETRPQRPWR